MYSNLLHSNAALYIVIGLLIFNYMLFKNQYDNPKKFIPVSLFGNIWGGLNLCSIYSHINNIEQVNLVFSLTLVFIGEYIFYYRYKNGILKGLTKIYFDISMLLSFIVIVCFSIIGIVFLFLSNYESEYYETNIFLCICIIQFNFPYI